MRKHVSGTPCLKTAFISCLNCTHPGAAPDSKPSIKPSAGTKRSGVEDNAELIDDNLSKKRMRPAPIVSKAPKQELSGNQERDSTGGSTTTRSDGDNVHLQPLVAMFDAVSQSSVLAEKDEKDDQSLVSIEMSAPDVADTENTEDFIPGLDSVARKDESPELVAVSAFGPTELMDGSQEQGSSLVRSSLEVVPSNSTDRSEELSPKAAITDVTSMNTSTATY
ncbi:hypothetical protein HAX54_045367 [Datura stramonium]|uniref:Uncharacterized protein n=1 Tax=Datura stramonium TaxID=4076 RepID=A0ABS8SQ60_DATST|nr:hypothetical protein [Datura stramonium]